MKEERGFIQILLLVVAIASIAGVGFVLRKNQETLPNTVNTAVVNEQWKSLEKGEKPLKDTEDGFKGILNVAKETLIKIDKLPPIIAAGLAGILTYITLTFISTISKKL